MNKFHARKVEEDGYCFDSQAEHRRYRELKLLVAAGEIGVDLFVHKRFPLEVNQVSLGYYEADFVYRRGKYGESELVIEDVKSAATRKLPVYRLKRKLVLALYGLEITEIEA